MSSRRATPAVFAALLLPLLAGCASAALDGSISEALDLSFSSTQILKNDKALQIDYLRSDGREVVMRITVVTEGVDLSKTVELGGEYAPGHPRASVSRAVDGEVVMVLPPIAKGTLDLDHAPQIGQDLSGSFGLSFGQGGDVGSGRSLSGKFDGMVQGAP